MTKIYYESDADLSVLDGQWVAVVGYGHQGRSWALNLRDSGLAVEVFTRADASQDQAEAEGFTAHEIEAASERVRRDLHPHPRRRHPRAAHHPQARCAAARGSRPGGRRHPICCGNAQIGG